MLQETYSDKKSILTWESECGGKILGNHGTKHSKGAMVIVNPKDGAKIVTLDIIITYAPEDSSQQLQFFHSIQQKLENHADKNIAL